MHDYLFLLCLSMGRDVLETCLNGAGDNVSIHNTTNLEISVNVNNYISQ